MTSKVEDNRYCTEIECTVIELYLFIPLLM